MRVYGSLALEDNSEVGEEVLGRCRISCVCTSAFQLPAKEADPQLAMGPSGDDLLISPTCEVAGSLLRFLEDPFMKGPGMVLGYFFMLSKSSLT